MSSGAVDARDQGALNQIAFLYETGDFAGAEAFCTSFLATLIEPHRQLPVHNWLGFITQRGGRLDEARAHFGRARQIDRRNPRLLVQLGAINDSLGNLDEAEALYREALRYAPQAPVAHYNLGVILQKKREWTAARRAFEAALMQHAAFPEAWLNLGNTLLQLEDARAAQECYQRALAYRPGMAQALHALGLLAQRHGRPDEARSQFLAAVEADPTFVDARLDLAENYFTSGLRAEALAAIEAALAVDPQHETARFKAAFYRAENPPQMPAAVVAKVFDGMAASFDQHLVGQLGYRIPTLLMEALAPHAQDGAWRVVDLGCGTGLFGVEVRRYSRQLVGVDLSEAMLAKARERGIYDELHKADAVGFLDAAGPFDLIAATDVLVYLGDLEPLFSAAAHGLERGGRLALSTESPEELGADFELQPTGRYAHARHYIERLAGNHGFALETRKATPIRTEANAPIPGYLYVLQRQ